MSKIAFPPCLFATALLIVLHADPAAAQTRVFVSTAGSDSNPCTVASPCRTFAHAYTTVAANGEIDVLTPGGYGGLTITHGISIQGHGFAGISVASGGTGITINATSSDAINLNGLLLDGGDVGNFGILFNSGKSLTVENCVARNMSIIGLAFCSTATTAQTLAVSNSYFSDNGQDGINIETDDVGAITASVDRTGLYGNGRDGLIVYGNSTGAATVAVTDSVASGNVTYGFIVQANPGNSGSNLSLTSSLAEGNATGVEAHGGSNAALWLAQSTVTGSSAHGFVADAGGVINSYGDNYIDTSNGTNTGSLTSVGKQ